jgi:hypothetical protein
LIVGLILAYFLPTFIAAHSKQRNTSAILDVLLGWTVAGWVIALVWSFTTDRAS